jgi:regulatory protein
VTAGGRKRAPRPVPWATEAVLDALALRYLERFDATTEKLRQVLMRGVHRSVRAHGGEVEAGRQIVEGLLARYRASGLVSDLRYATSMAAGLRARGTSRNAIRARLRGRGVPDEVLGEALEAAGVGDAGGELEAARVFARKRRLGPFRGPEDRARYRRRDLAAMARAGFMFEVCRVVLGEHADETD